MRYRTWGTPLRSLSCGTPTYIYLCGQIALRAPELFSCSGLLKYNF
jgi:hypothetical protein